MSELLEEVNPDIAYFINSIELDEENKLVFINVKEEASDILHIIEAGLSDVHGYDLTYIFDVEGE